jgi:serine/threonine-protein kinase
MLGDYGEVWVLDWGCAKVAGTTYIPGPIDVDMPAPGETHDGAVIGTPGFMAPEQLVAGAACDHRVDVYALGCVLFEILAGQSLHPAGPGAVRSTVIGCDARPSSRAPDADIPPELDDVCVRATARDPDARYPRVRDLHDAVLHYLDGDRDLGRRRELAAVHLVAARAARGCDQPAVAMREAGRALALDPSSGDAATLVAQLMLEPPATRPPEVEVAIAASDAEISRVHGRATVFAYIAYACMLALFYVQGITDGRMFAVISVLVAVLASGACIASRMREVPSLPLVTLMLLGNALLIALLSRFAGPFAVLPATLCSTIIALVSHPALLAHPVRVVVIMMAGFLAPFGLEAAGIWEPTWSVTGGALLSRSAFVDFTGPGVAPLLVLLVVADTAWTGWTTWKLVRVHRDAQSRLELHAWHLRQLVGDDRDRASP